MILRAAAGHWNCDAILRPFIESHEAPRRIVADLERKPVKQLVAEGYLDIGAQELNTDVTDLREINGRIVVHSIPFPSGGVECGSIPCASRNANT